MRLFPSPLEIGEEEGFTKEKDIFKRKTLGDGLTGILTSVRQPLVVAIDAQWGDGKTTILKMWAGSLRQRGIPVVFFDAFANDYIDDAFLALAGEIIDLTVTLGKAKTSRAKKVLASAVTVGKVLLRSGVKVGVGAASAGLVSGTALSSVASEIAEEAKDLVDSRIGELLTTHGRNRRDLQAFKDALGQLPELLAGTSEADNAAEESIKEESIKPLVLIIDELDRCRPTFALEVLERVKHIFDATNVHFVLGADMRQLSNSVKVAYGSEIDSQTYLQKFVHLTVRLQDNSDELHESTAAKVVSYLKQNMEFAHEDRDTVEYTARTIALIAELGGLSLRAIERCFTLVAISLAFTGPRFYRPDPILAGLCIMKITRPDLFAQARDGTLRYIDVIGALHLGRQPSEHWKYDHETAVEYWRVCTDESAPGELVGAYAEGLPPRLRNPRKLLRYVASDIVDRLVPRS